MLPAEILIPILAELSPISILALSSTCRSLRNIITEPLFLDRVLRDAILHGGLRWICPVATIPKSETKRARKALVGWLDGVRGTLNATTDGNNGGGGDDPSEGEKSLLENNTDASDKDADEGSDEDDEEESEEDDSESSDDEDDETEGIGGGKDPVSLLTSPNFPRLAFIRACWDSDSMMNRKRLWGQVKRFEVLWRDYRTNGWQDPRFYAASTSDEAE